MDEPTDVETSEPAASEAALEPCPTEPGDVLTEQQATEGCAGPNGDLVMMGVHQCTDGRQLLGDRGLWGWVGEPLNASDDMAGDPDYAEAYDECIG